MKKPSKPAKYSQRGKYGAEPTPLCPHCGIFMTRQAIRTHFDKKSSWWPTSWICLICGHMELDTKRFEVVKEDDNPITYDLQSSKN